MKNKTKKIAWYSNNLPQSDFNYCKCELLFRNGTFYLMGEGGAWTIFAKTYPDRSIGSGSGTRKISRADALEWIEGHEKTAYAYDECKEKYSWTPGLGGLTLPEP